MKMVIHLQITQRQGISAQLNDYQFLKDSTPCNYLIMSMAVYRKRLCTFCSAKIIHLLPEAQLNQEVSDGLGIWLRLGRAKKCIQSCKKLED